MTVVEKAIEFAKRAHAGQKRKGTEREYIQHPLEAMRIVAGLTDDEEIIAAAVLHDTLEDELAKVQNALDLVNSTVQFEVDL